jgi:hypothetical protein
MPFSHFVDYVDLGSRHNAPFDLGLRAGIRSFVQPSGSTTVALPGSLADPSVSTLSAIGRRPSWAEVGHAEITATKKRHERISSFEDHGNFFMVDQ